MNNAITVVYSLSHPGRRVATPEKRDEVSAHFNKSNQ